MVRTKTAKELGVSPPYSRHAMAYVLAGGRGSRLMELTDRRAKPAVYFGGKSRIIDFALSNALNSGIRRIAVATQYKAHSLIRHLQRGWNFFRPERNESFDILPASQRVSETMWYLGTADAVYQNIDIIESYGPLFIVLLRATTSTRWTTRRCCSSTSTSEADVTVGCLEASLEEAKGFGVMHVDDQDRIISFLEKPKNPPSMPGKPDVALCSMGIYVFETTFLIDLLKRDAADTNSSHDFGKDIIPYIVKNGKAVAHHFSDSCVISTEEAKHYWRDVGTVDAYWAANIDLTDIVPDLDLYDRAWPIWTYGEITPPAKFVHDIDGRRGLAISSLLSGGCIVSGAAISRSLVFTGVHVHSYSTIHEAVILPYARIGRNVRLSKVVIDAEVIIPDGLVVGEDPELDAEAVPAHRGRRDADHRADDRKAQGMSELKVLSVASEIFPLVKTGGLADVAGALPGALKREDVLMRTLIPAYPAVKSKLAEVSTAREYDDLFGGPARVLAGAAAGLDLFAIDAPHLYDRPGNPYLGPDGLDWPDNARRFAALARVGADIGLGAIPAFEPEVVHAHDWQAALAPAYLHFSAGPRPGTMVTIHNLAFQGHFPLSVFSELGLPESALTIDGVEYFGGVGYLKAGLRLADASRPSRRPMPARS